MMARALLYCSFCLSVCISVFGGELFPRQSTVHYLKGTGEASSPINAWRLPSFDDSAWSSGPAPIYYGEPLTGTLLEDMRGNYTSVFVRKNFSISNPATIESLELSMLSDDGCVAWINGIEVARFNMPDGDPVYDQSSLPALSEPIPWETYSITNASSILVPGTNVLAVEAFNSSIASSSDFVFDASLSAAEDVTPPRIADTVPSRDGLVASLKTIEVIFSESVTGVDAADLLINGVPARTVTSFGADDYVFEFPEPPTGIVNISWVRNPGISDLSSNFFTGDSWTYELNPDAPAAQIMISEFMTDNDNTLRDEDGASSDWIEIFNPTADPVNLEGWFLTDATNNLARWRFPAVSLEANSYLVVFASEKNRTNPASQLHTNFKLANSSGFLALSDPSTNVVSWFNYPAQREDVSYGRERANPAAVGFFPKPTPGSPNIPGGPGFAPDVHFSRAGGTFTKSFQLELSTTSSNAVIHYALGKNLPTEDSPIYTGPITITNTVQVRAQAFEAGLLPGDPHSESYLLLSGPVVSATSDLPIVVFHNYGGGSVPATGEQFVMMQVFEPKNGIASLTNPPDLSQRARFRRRGSSTQDYPKWSLALETWNEFNDDEKVSILGMPEESDWVFYAPNNFEPVLIHNPFMYQLSRDIGRYASRTRFVEVYLNTSGGAIQQANYFGIYVVEEKIKRGPDRVDVDPLEPQNLNPPEVTGGYLLKIDRPDPGDSPFSAAGQQINYVYPKSADVRSPARAAQKKYIEGYFAQFGTALNSGNFRDPVNGYAKYVDVPSWIDYHLLDVLAFNVDALRLSTYFYKPRNGKITYGPLWDFDRALGSTDGRDANPSTWGDTGGSSFFTYPWWGRMFQDADFYQKWIDRWEELRLNQLSTTNINRLIDELSGQVKNAQPRELARWHVSPRGGSYQSEVNLMKSYLQRRTSFIDAQFVRPPVADVPAGNIDHGTLVSLSGPANATIYYTLDGSDPRLSGGGISPNAQIYSAPILLDSNVRLNARSRDPAHALGPVKPSPVWSGLVAGTYIVEVPPLRITEIMYNPAPLTGSTNDSQDFEFIELKNAGITSLDLTGFAFTNGITFQFTSGSLAPGARTVVVKNKAAFQKRYGTAISVAGEFSGSLDNSGERITLVGPLQEIATDFSYNKGWAPLADGPGFSLVPRDENADGISYDNSSIWRASARPGGSPGEADPAPGTFASVVVNELLSHPAAGGLDKVELYNSSNVAADVSGWYLTDNLEKPRQFKLPAGTVIPASGYITFDETKFNPNGKGFAFSAAGEAAYLLSADASGEFSGYLHGFTFGAAGTDVSFGRYLSSDGVEHFPAQSRTTFGAPNALPRYGPIMISEVMFHPSDASTNDNTQDEYIELQNVAPQAVGLFDASRPGNTWHLRGGTDFDFPQGSTLLPGQFALIVSFDPADASLANSFRSRLSVPATAQLFGPFAGKLSNTGQRISLQRPDAVEGTDSSVPYIVVDEFSYSTGGSWVAAVAANGSGKSLQRTAGSYADDPASWTAMAPTPGFSAAGTNPDSDGDGLPDVWEAAHGLNSADPSGENGPAGDPDGDGVPNLQEYLGGTDPRDPSSLLSLSASRLGTGAKLTFKAVADHSYSIFYRTDIATGSWVKLTDVPASSSDQLREFIDPLSNATRFYRVITPSQ